MARPVALIPLNDLSRAKGRLAEALTPAARSELARATFRQVVSAASDAGCDVRVLVARAKDVDPAAHLQVILEDPARHGLNAQLEYALAAIEAPEILILHADLPLITAGEIERLVEAAPAPPSATLVRSRDGGTNAMFLRPPGRFPLHYGPGSFDLHVAAARRAGVAVQAFESDILALDLDTPDDLQAFLSHPASRDTDIRALLDRLLKMGSE